MSSNDLEYVGKMNPQRLTSFEEGFRLERAQFQKDELDRALRRVGKLQPEPVETSHERFPEEA